MLSLKMKQQAASSPGNDINIEKQHAVASMIQESKNLISVLHAIASATYFSETSQTHPTIIWWIV